MDWTDRRIDDLSTLVHANDRALEEVTQRVNDHDHQITQIMRTGDRRSDRSWTLTVVLITVTLTALANIIVTIVHH